VDRKIKALKRGLGTGNTGEITFLYDANHGTASFYLLF
jgi:hypothetical protein